MSRAGTALRLVVVTALALAGVAALSRFPYAAPDAGASLLRLSWRVRGAGEEICRKSSDDELATLPVHMRRPEVCETVRAEYRLRIVVDGQVIEDTIVAGAGVRADRPLFVFREIPLEPGRHEIDVAFTPAGRQDSEGARGDVGGEPAAGAGNRGRGGGGNVFAVSAGVELDAGDVALVTLDADGTGLVIRSPGRR